MKVQYFFCLTINNIDIVQYNILGLQWMTTEITQKHKKMTQIPKRLHKKKFDGVIGPPVEIFPDAKIWDSVDFLHSGIKEFAKWTFPCIVLNFFLHSSKKYLHNGDFLYFVLLGIWVIFLCPHTDMLTQNFFVCVWVNSVVTQ